MEEKENKRTDENDVAVWVEKNRQGRRHFFIPLRLDGEFMTLGERLPASDGNRAEYAQPAKNGHYA